MAYSREEAAKLVIQAGLDLVEKGLIARTWGNISARLSDTEFLITPSGMAYENLTPEKLVVCKIADCSYQGTIKPSSEKGVHAEVYQYRKEINFVIHTHQLYATAVGAVEKTIYGRNEAEKELLGEGVYCAKYAISSTKALKNKVSKEIQLHRKSNAFFMRFHGVLCLGKDEKEAFAVSKTLEDICEEKIYRLRNANEKEKGITKIESQKKEAICEEIRRACGYAVTCFDTQKEVKEVSEWGKRVYPVIDDMAQIAGTSFLCLDPKDEKLVKKTAAAMKNRNCVFIKGWGAICSAADKDEAEAVQMVLEKNCLAALYCKSQGIRKHLGCVDAHLQRRVYVNKYSKLK